MHEAALSPLASDTADPLGLRRCAKCLYDRFGLADGRPCPECGYVLPAGVSVMTLPRPRESWWSIGTMIGVAIVLVSYVVRDPLGTVHGLDYFVVLIATSLVGAGLRWGRLNASPDAYACQIWMTPDGIGFERDADRFSTARSVERSMSPLMFVLLVAALLLPSGVLRGSSPAALCAFLGIFTVVAVAQVTSMRKRRGTFAPPLDDVAPRLTRWDAIDAIEIEADGARALKATMRLNGFSDKYRTIRFAGTPDRIKPIEGAIGSFRTRGRADNPTRP